MLVPTPPASTPAVSVGPGKSVHFAVIADDGRRSMTWTVWTSRHTLDAYLTARPFAGTLKVSLHQSGSWQIGFTAEKFPEMAHGLPSRHLDIWPAPEPFGPGMRRSVELVIPDSELRVLPPGTVPDPKLATRVPAPGAGFAACIEFVFMADQPTPLVLNEPVFDVASLKWHDETAVRVIARQMAWGPVDVDWLRQSKQKVLDRMDPEALRQAANPRILLHGKHDDERRYLVDAAGDLT